MESFGFPRVITKDFCYCGTKPHIIDRFGGKFILVLLYFALDLVVESL
ncbi:hypothetical protein [Mycobacterium leprae]|nr:hypothetical protein [Mycobacterium leprae]